MKGYIIRLVAIILSISILFTLLVGCSAEGEENQENLPPDFPDELLGITEDTVWVGNTIAITGEYADMGSSFKLGIEAAFAAYNARGGYNGKSIKLKHYDDGGIAARSLSLMEKLVFEDEVFAIVGNFGTYALDVNLDIIKDAAIPMIYAAADNSALLNENATTPGDRAVFPVRPLNLTEGRMLLLRAFAPLADASGNPLGGLGAAKVGVIYNSSEASKTLLSGINSEAENLGEAQRANIVYSEASDADYSAAVNALKRAGCDVVILAVIGADFLTALTAMAEAEYYCKALTSYNNASTDMFNENNLLAPGYESIFSNVALYAQDWIDIFSTTYVYNGDTPLNAAYKALAEAHGLTYTGTPGFNEAYWAVAEKIYSYALTVNPETALEISRDRYALEGYVAGDLFCQAMEALEKSGKALSGANLVSIMESQEFRVVMADNISFANGMRTGVQSFALTSIYDVFHLDASVGGGVRHRAESVTVHGFTTIDDYRAAIAK